MNNQELQHFGVPGMKWGVRKPEDRVGRARQARQMPQQSKKSQAVRKKAKWSQLSTGRKVATALLRTNSVLAASSIPSLLAASGSGKVKAINASMTALTSIGGFALADYLSTVEK